MRRLERPPAHCEYFASALALMLRSQGIPARLVVGFRADEFSELSGTYRVRQAHAHAWVEAYVPPQRLPAGTARPDGIFDWSHGAWLRLDPTPSFSTRPTGVAGLTRQVENWLTLLHSFWRDHVLSMSATRQREALYRPLVVQVRQAAADLTNPGTWDAAGAQTLLGWGTESGEQGSSLRSLLATFDRAKGMGVTNRGRYSNPEFDKVLATALVTMDDKKREALIQQAAEMAMNDTALIPIHYEVSTWATAKSHRYTPRTDQYTLAMGLKPAK